MRRARMLVAIACAAPALALAQAAGEAPSCPASPAERQRTLQAIEGAQASPKPSEARPPVERPLPMRMAYGCPHDAPEAGDPVPVRRSFAPEVQDSTLNAQ